MKRQFEHVRVVYIDSTERTRYERYITRAREGVALSLDEFRQLDREQWSFGLLRIAEDLADIKIVNEDALEDFYQQTDFVAGELEGEAAPGVRIVTRPAYTSSRNRLYRLLKALVLAEGAKTTEELQELTRDSGRVILHNNVNKVLKGVPELATRHENAGQRVRYEATPAAVAYVRLVELQNQQGVR